MKLSHVLKPIPAAALAALAVLPVTGAAGSASQATIMQDDAQIIFSSATRRADTLNEMHRLGADIVKIRMQWRFIAPSPNGKKKPKGFDASNPSAYPASNWAPYDDAIRKIVARGMRPYLMLSGPAPRWAGGKSGIKRPKPSEFKHFAQAVGTRYAGSSGPVQNPLAPSLPRVSLYSPWNEPNLYNWLLPQTSHGRLVSPHVYRRLLYAAASGLQAAGHGAGELLIGELLPSARSSSPSKRISPIRFLREMACVDSRYRPYKGSAAKQRGCKGFKPLPGAGLAYHPYTLAGGPDVHSPSSDDATIAELSRVTSALDRLSARHRLRKSQMPIWITEFGFQTRPPDRYASPIHKVPAFMGQSEWLAFKNPRVASYSQYPLVDDKIDSQGNGFQSGLRFHNGKKKPGVYKAFQRPFFVELRPGGKYVEVFGGVRTGAPGTKVTIESRVAGKGSFKKLGTSSLGSAGYFDRVLHAPGAAKRQFRFTFSGGKSRTATAHS